MLHRHRIRLTGLAIVLLALLLSACGSQQIRYGPFTIPASDNPGSHETAAHLDQLFTNVQKPCTDCSIISFAPKVTYANGSEANWNTDVMLHHAVWMSSARNDLTCPSLPERFFASGNERTPILMPGGYGYRVGSGDSWNLLVDLMNMSGEAQTVYIDVIFGFGNATDQAVTPVWLDIDNCGDSQYTIPAGFSDTHRDWRTPWAGKVVSMGGHLHDGGVFVEATNETSGQSICKSTPGYGTKPGSMGHLDLMTVCVDNNAVATFGSNDLIRLHSVYDTEMSMDDVMGIMLGYAVRAP